jgi:peptide/nickel transport system substrate-binding protein/glutathione transport system substrate-binding protein
MTAAAAGLAMAGCAGGPGEQPTASPTPGEEGEEKVKKGGILRQAMISGWNLDPMLDVTAGLLMTSKVYTLMYLVLFGTDEIVLLALDRDIEQPDHLTYIFHIHDNIHFHDNPDVRKRYPSLAGRQVTAEDIKYSIERYRGLSMAPGRDYHLNYLDHIEVLDPYTLKVINKRPYSWTLSPMNLGSAQAGPIIPREVIEKEGDLKTTAIGSGPFMLKSASQTGGILLERNPNYFVAGEPYLDGMDAKIINTNEGAEAAFRAGEIDGFSPPNKLIADSLKGMAGTKFTKGADLGYAAFGVKGDIPPWNDERVRRALNLAIDRDDMILKLEGGRTGDDPTELGLWSGPVTWAMEWYSLSQEELRKLYVHDPEEAKKLLSAAGYPSIDVTMKHLNLGKYPDLAQVVAGQLRKVGINARLEPQDVAVYLPKTLYQAQFEMTSFYNLTYVSPEFPLRFFTTRGIAGTGNWFGYSDKEIDDMNEDIAQTFDKEERRNKVLDIQRLIISKNPPLMSLYARYTYSVSRDYVKAGHPEWHGAGAAFNYTVWLDK